MQEFYYFATLKNQGNLEAMKNAIYATLYHCSSTDDNPTHHLCPTGDDSWCFYQEAKAKNITPKSHEVGMRHYIRKEITDDLLPIYEKHCSDEFLLRLTGKTQNANESLHNVIWSFASKTMFYGLERMNYLIAKGIMQFNHGYMTPSFSGIGQAGLTVATRQDKERLRKILAIGKQKEERRSKRKRNAEEEAQKIQKEGTSYKAGGF